MERENERQHACSLVLGVALSSTPPSPLFVVHPHPPTFYRSSAEGAGGGVRGFELGLLLLCWGALYLRSRALLDTSLVYVEESEKDQNEEENLTPPTLPPSKRSEGTTSPLVAHVDRSTWTLPPSLPLSPSTSVTHKRRR